MSDLVFVVRSGHLKNLTLQSIKFDYYGGHTKLPVIECDDFSVGFNLAKEQNYKYAMFVDSGTVFVDVKEFLNDLGRYPHQGLIGHIIDPLDSTLPFYLHTQAFMLELAEFDSTDFSTAEIITNVAQRSTDNIHDEYTPWWIKPTEKTQTYPAGYFGTRLIAKQFSKNKLVANFKQILRKNKQYLYTEELVNDYLNTQQAYCDVAENQLWVFNNEPYTVKKVRHLVSPASGLFWVFHALHKPRQINLVDISNEQLDFAMELWLNWDGNDYGTFVSNYIKERGVKHYLIDNKSRSKIEQIELSKPSVLIKTVNTIFDSECEQHNIDDFANKWQLAKHRVTVLFHNQDILKYLEQNKDGTVWMSNVLDYKYTMLKNYD